MKKGMTSSSWWWFRRLSGAASTARVTTRDAERYLHRLRLEFCSQIAPNGVLYAGTLTGKVAALENSYDRTVACAKGSADGSGGRRSNLRR
ncbi:hypothetical protein AHAS_Ahas08G0150500 [Arachis hypogaea]